VWARALVVAAGPLANFVLAVVIFTLILATFGESIIRPRIGKVEPNSAAAAAGFQAGDLIKSLDGHPIADYSELKRYVVVRAEQPIRVEFERDGKILEVVATPRRQSETNALIGGSSKVGMLGLGSSTQRQDYFIRRYNPIEAMGHGVVKTYDILGTTLTYLGRLVRGLESGDQLGGPLRTAAISGAVAKAGVDAGNGLGTQILGMGLNLLNLAGVLSVGIGFMNLLPVPVLDGGHLLFYAYEAAARRPLGAQVQAAGYRVGLALLLGLMLFATWNDLQQLRVFKILGGLFS
jgi:regulator of sigma E protease